MWCIWRPTPIHLLGMPEIGLVPEGQVGHQMFVKQIKHTIALRQQLSICVSVSQLET